MAPPPPAPPHTVVQDEDSSEEATSSDEDEVQRFEVPRSTDLPARIQNPATQRPNIRPETYTTIAATQRQNMTTAHTPASIPQGQGQRVSVAIGQVQTPLPHILSTLPPLLTKFCAYGAGQYANCADFASQRPELWDDVELLPNIAFQLLNCGETETAKRVISRYWMLKRSMELPTNAGRTRWLKQLGSVPGQATKFEELCNKYYIQLRARLPAVNNGPSPQLAHGVPAISQNVNVPYSDRSNLGPVGTRRISMSSGGSRPGMNIVIKTPPVDTLTPLPQFGKPSKYQNSEKSQSDMDSGILPGGKAYIGLSGPKTDMMQGWPDQLKDKLYAEYKVHIGKPSIDGTFEVGCLVAVFWHENLGHSIPHKYKDKVATKPVEGNLGKGFLTKGPKGEFIYSHVRRFVFVVRRAGHSIGIPITSYSNKGLSAKTLSDPERRAHAIIYAHGTKPDPLRLELKFTKQPICVKIDVPNETLSPTSRLYYAKPQSIDHNIKVKYIGRVIDKDVRRLVTSFKTELFSEGDD